MKSMQLYFYSTEFVYYSISGFEMFTFSCIYTWLLVALKNKSYIYITF